jgi:lipase chaperone LimK
VNIEPSPATRSKRRGVFIALARAIVVAAVAFVFFGASGHRVDSLSNNGDVSQANSGERDINIQNRKISLRTSAPILTGANRLEPQYAPKMLLQTPAFARTMEDVIGEALGSGNMRDDPQGFRTRLAERVRARFAPELAAHALAFAHRYVNYLESLDAANLSAAAHDPTALRGLYETRKSIRQAHFSPEEYETLFARDDRLDRYTIAGLEIQADTQRTSAEKTAAREAAANELTPAERQERAQWQSHLTLQRQTAQFYEKQTSDAERFAARAAEHGEPAAQRLAELDRSERDWDARLAQYESALNANRNGTLANDALAATRDQLFNERERLRLEAALSLLRRKQNRS